jgi:hypothetical protein
MKKVVVPPETKVETIPAVEFSGPRLMNGETWADASTIGGYEEVLDAISEELVCQETFSNQVEYLHSILIGINEKLFTILRKKNTAISSDGGASDKDKLGSYHSIITTMYGMGEKVRKSRDDLDTAINETLEGKRKILDGWNDILADIGESAAKQSSVKSSYSMIVAPPASQGDRCIVIGSGLANITTPICNSVNNVPPMGIRYNTTMGVFVINLNGTLYSFGEGSFIENKRRSEKLTRGKRCDVSIGKCGRKCTYYHDPLHFIEGHKVRHMSMFYICEVLIRSVATDMDILKADTIANTPHFVADLVQLAGMLMLKAMSTKKVLDDRQTKIPLRRSKPPRHSGATR